MRALDLKLFRDLWAMRGQVLAIAAVIMGGVATLVMSLSTYDSLVITRDRFYRDYRFADAFVNLKRAPESVAARLAAIPGVERVETRVRAGVKLEVAGFTDPITGLLFSLPDGTEPLLNTLHFKRGRWVQPDNTDEVVVSDTFADAHRLNPGDKISAIINGKRKQLTIVGVAVSPEYVYQIAPGSMFPDFKRYGVLWMGRNALGAAYGMKGAFNNATLSLTPGTPVQEVIDRMDALLGTYGGTGAYARKDQFSNRFINEELNQLQITATIFPAIFLGVAAFLLNVVVGRLVALQREQIAILKAFGYSGLAIGGHYVKLVMLLVLLGVAGGVALGAWFGQGLSNVYMETTFRFPYLDYRLETGVILIALAVSAVAAVSGTLFAVHRAIRLTPAEGMRAETPALYRATVFERIGLQRWFTQPTRMILRNIERRPVKSLLTVFGIACACGLMMVGNYQKGAIDFMVDVQFRQASREDLAVTFIEPTGSRALHELQALPGVRHVEGFRDVPAILRFQHYSYRSAVYGIQPEGELHRSLNAALQPIRVPPDGVVLTEHLAREILHVKPGDLLTVEVLEGSRPVRQVPVLGITQQYLGVSAYMQQDSLNALLREGNVVSGAYLDLDPGMESTVYAELHKRPRVLGMIANAAAVRSFYDTIGEFVLFYNMVATLLAGSIGFGVVYNSARLALSERGRELASLRVLGFTHGEIAYILLGELGLLTLIAIPLGFLVGVGLCGILVLAFTNDLYRLPLIIEPSNYALGATVVVISALVSGLLVWYRLGRLDLVAVLKTRE
ncbi:MAG: ABC transporter permease [Gammaproteobacteria bacterium]|nr:ABC transporter permease [Rhodocyclaceae bacterium]MBU3909670.1 ABC transporter permease [Gammaproteobacteria bacterium]MBU3988020.1 ABC transporter permease [Gammaproteobacteria bacterium]MBU4005203.1 ABC transporter permease [Gammaproteobacteria bacterium]MBU4022382.1 ABC transporter permease [Gammaproteobacteria bacterium]